MDDKPITLKELRQLADLTNKARGRTATPSQRWHAGSRRLPPPRFTWPRVRNGPIGWRKSNTSSNQSRARWACCDPIPPPNSLVSNASPGLHQAWCGKGSSGAVLAGSRGGIETTGPGIQCRRNGGDEGTPTAEPALDRLDTREPGILRRLPKLPRGG